MLDQKSDKELLQSVIAETAKATNEVRCAQADLDKAHSRLNFVLMLTNTLINRKVD